MKIYLINWENNNMIGGFYEDSLEQAFNSYESTLAWSLQLIMNMHHVKSIEIEFLSNHDELNKLRKSRQIKQKELLA